MQNNYPDDNYKHSEISNQIIKCFYKVYNTLGYGFLEKVYENSLMKELQKNNLEVEKKQIKVSYDGDIVGEYYADLMVANKIIIEIKAAEALIEEHEHQLLNYLKATDVEVGLLLNFGKKPEIRIKVFSNKNKNLSLS